MVANTQRERRTNMVKGDKTEQELNVGHVKYQKIHNKTEKNKTKNAIKLG